MKHEMAISVLSTFNLCWVGQSFSIAWLETDEHGVNTEGELFSVGVQVASVFMVLDFFNDKY